MKNLKGSKLRGNLIKNLKKEFKIWKINILKRLKN